MKIQQLSVDQNLSDWHQLPTDADLILAFGERSILSNDLINKIKESCPSAEIIGGSTSGAILNTDINKTKIVLTAINFDNVKLKAHRSVLSDMEKSFEVGAETGKALNTEDLKMILVISDGLGVNGSQLIEGIDSEINDNVLIAGGLAGDGEHFSKTLVLDKEGLHENSVISIGFYGDSLEVSTSASGGWRTFGPYKTVTKSEGNVVYEIDDQPALDVYSKYLGDEAQDLPGSGLLYPIELIQSDSEQGLTRTLLGVDFNEGSLTFAGNVPKGSTIRLLHASMADLCDGAEQAASIATAGLEKPDLALAVSCVGRKMLLGEQCEQELVAINDVFKHETPMSGFYSYGEIIPIGNKNGVCLLHNQTMTLILIKEN